MVFFETRRESGARDSTRKAESSFSATCADRVTRDVGGEESAGLGGSGLAGGGAGARRGDGNAMIVGRGWTAADFPGKRAGGSGGPAAQPARTRQRAADKKTEPDARSFGMSGDARSGAATMRRTDIWRSKDIVAARKTGLGHDAL